MTERLTNDQIRQFVEDGGNVCPYCGSIYASTKGNDYIGSAMYRQERCNDCNHEWVAIFLLAGLFEDGINEPSYPKEEEEGKDGSD